MAHPYEATRAPEPGELVNDAFAAGDFNRELRALVAALAELAGRLTAFAESDPAPDLLAALVARGVNRSAAVVGVAELMESADSPEVARDAARALAWAITQAVAEMRSVSLRPPAGSGT